MSPPVDISEAIADARQQVADAEEGPYRELMATYVQLGELLDSGRSDVDYEGDCRALVDRLVEIGREIDRTSEQRWFSWMAHNTTFGEEVEGGQ